MFINPIQACRDYITDDFLLCPISMDVKYYCSVFSLNTAITFSFFFKYTTEVVYNDSEVCLT